MSVTKKLILVLIPVLVLMIGLAGILFLLPSNSDSVYVAQIAQAKKLAESGDYQNAIVYFQNAINEDSSQEEPYLELAKVYFNLNDLTNAINILREGLSTTNSVQISKELEYYEQMENNSAANELERLGLTEKAEFNEKTSDAFATYNYAKYTKDCTVKNETIVSDKYTVEYQQYNAVFEYVNSLETPVLDPAATRTAPSGVTACTTTLFQRRRNRVTPKRSSRAGSITAATTALYQMSFLRSARARTIRAVKY